MVYFNCDGCGETLRKSNVDAHAFKCRLCASVSCVDCNVSYFGDDYRTHTSCVTEAERYEKSVYKGQNKNKKSKLTPQQLWIQLITKSVEKAQPRLKHLLNKIVELGDNCPRKEKQFRNFVSNSLSLRNNKEDTLLITELWAFLQKCRVDEQQIEQAKETSAVETKTTAASQEQSSKLLLSNEVVERSIAETTIEANSETNQMFEAHQDDGNHKLVEYKVIKAMKKVLKKSPGQKMKLKELRKQVKVKLALEKQLKGRLKIFMHEQLKANIIDKVKLDGKTVLLI